MKITKYGHCCLLIETKGLRILTDPGAWNDLPPNSQQIDYLLITHEHPDHLHINSVKQLISTNPALKIITNSSVGKILDAENIQHEIVEDSQQMTVQNVTITGCGDKHAEIYEGIDTGRNTGYLIDKFYYPGDSFFNPKKEIDLLALPVIGPWMHLSEAIDFAKEIKPKLAFPVHDGMLKHIGPFHAIPAMLLPKFGIEFKPLTAGESFDFGEGDHE